MARRHLKAGALTAPLPPVLVTVGDMEKANVLTINSIIPTNGHALVTITAEMTDVTVSIEDLLNELRSSGGVIKAEIIAG